MIRMNLKNGIIALTLGLLMAATPVFSKVVADVNDIVKKTKAAYASTQAAEIKFEQTAGSGSSNGTLTYAKGDKYRLELGKQTIVSNGSKVWTYTPEKRQVLVSKAVSGTNRLTPEDLLTAFPGDYSTQLLGEQKVNGRAVWVVRCTPGAGKKIGDVSRATLYIDKASYRFQQVEVESPSLGTMKIRIISAQYGAKVPDSRFTFQAPKDVRVVDLTR
jgi:outer membrane lipoprotein-sorting protein